MKAVHLIPSGSDRDKDCISCDEPVQFCCANCGAGLCFEHGGHYSHESEDPGTYTHTWCLDEIGCKGRQ